MRIKTNGSWLAAKQIGPVDAEEVVLITGFIGVASFWDLMLPVIAKKYHVTVFDQRGTGNSGPFNHPLSIKQMANDAELILRDLCGKPVHLLGHSAGAGISLMLASRLQEKIKSVTLLAGWTKADAWMQRVFDARLKALKHSGPEAYTKLTTLFMTPHTDVALLDKTLNKAELHYAKQMPVYEEIKARAKAVSKFNSNEFVVNVKCPTLVMGAKDDAMTPFYFSQALSKSISHSRLFELETGGHYFPRTRVNETLDPILNFLNANKNKQ